MMRKTTQPFIVVVVGLWWRVMGYGCCRMRVPKAVGVGTSARFDGWELCAARSDAPCDRR
jgi:hypothetical protein